MAHASRQAEDWATMLPWRRSQLRRAGFDAALAAQIAADLRYDVRAILQLTDRGCPAPLAARILAPIDPPPA
ncbi:MAG: hypothetical protein JWR63_2519 [Conexibacter sp.]|nr:hypothetical protein [Conexibacter sp.]